ncbi:MAG: hypothetical protein M1816_001887 [Peltula sp. TS41687]|nr:MAG: hypothetical protein M1816_001887 [Peltula sp. TS41687]
MFRLSKDKNRPVKRDFSAEDFDEALSLLDVEISKSKELRSVVRDMGPIKLIAIGGFVAVGYLKSRASTHDIDYLLEPRIEQNSEARSEPR